jgi:hypothetical protein
MWSCARPIRRLCGVAGPLAAVIPSGVPRPGWPGGMGRFASGPGGVNHNHVRAAAPVTGVPVRAGDRQRGGRAPGRAGSSCRRADGAADATVAHGVEDQGEQFAGGRGIQAVVRASASGQVTGTVPVPSAIPVEWADSGGTFVTAAADDRSFIIGVQGGQAPTKTGLDLRLFRFAISDAGKPGHLTELAPAPMRNETTEGIALSPDGKLLAVSLMSNSAGNTAPTIQVLNLATGATRTWTAPTRNYPYLIGPPSWADGSRVIAFSWLNADQSGLMSAPRGIRLLDTAAPGDNLVAGTVIVPRGMVAAGSIVSALITPDGRDVIVVTWRDLTPHAKTHTIVVQFAELQASTGRLVRLLRTQTARYDQVHVITLQVSLGVLSLGSQGRYALVQGVKFGWLDVGGPDLGRFAPLPAVPAGQYVNFAAW